MADDEKTQAALDRAAIDSALDAIVTIDATGRIVEFNPGAERVFGHRRADTLGRSLEELLVPEPSRRAHREGIRRYLRTGEHHFLGRRMEVSALHADGRVLTVELAITPVRISSETYFTAYLRDVSAALAARERLDSLARFPAEDPDPVLRISMDGEVLYTNEAARRVASLFETAEKRRGDPALVETARRAKEQGTRVELDHCAGDATYCLEFVPVATKSYVNVYARDVSVERRAADMLRASEQQLRLITENIPFLLLRVDADLNIRFCNETYGAWFERPTSDILGTRLDALLSPEHMATVGPEIAEVLQGRSINGESVVTYPDGVTRYALRQYVPDRDDSGRVIGLYAFTQDISDLKRIEQDLIGAKAEAERANEAKSDLLATVSHEMRTPLHGMLGMLETLRDSELSSEQQSIAVTAERSGRALLAVINDILDVSQADAGRLELALERFSLRGLLGDCVAVARSSVKDDRIELVEHFDDRVPEALVGDPARLRQVLLNLLGNAIKFTERGKVRLGTTLIAQDDTAARVRFTVSDTGCGIAREDLDEIFEPFSRPRASQRTSLHGTGLGLTISRRLVHLMGGDIDVRSELGEGSEFTVDVPLDLADAETIPDEAAPARARTSPAEMGGTTGTARVLVVDDSATNQQVARLFLQSEGYEVEATYNGTDALRRVLEDAFDVVLMDVAMPGIDGLETTRRLRAAGVTVPVVALTAQAVAGDRERCRAAGMNDYLAKPVRREVLLETVHRWLGKRAEQVRDEASAPEGAHDTLDGQVLERLRDDVGAEVFDEVLSSFIEEMSTLVVQLRSIEATSPGAELAAAGGVAHTLKGCAASVGARRLESCARAVENACRNGDATTASAHARALGPLADDVVPLLEAAGRGEAP